MGVGKQLNSEVGAWGVLAIVLVLVMIVINTLKETGSGKYICDSVRGGTGFFYYNQSSDLCCNGTATAVNSCAGATTSSGVGNATSINTIGTTSNDFITGLSEPKNWVAIFVIALIGFSIITFVRKKRGG